MDTEEATYLLKERIGILMEGGLNEQKAIWEARKDIMQLCREEMGLKRSLSFVMGLDVGINYE